MGVFQRALSGDGQLAVAVAAIKALTSVIENSKASTMMGLEIELSRAAETLRRGNPTSISLSAGCELFMRCGLPCALQRRAASLMSLVVRPLSQVRDANSRAGLVRLSFIQGLVD